MANLALYVNNSASMTAGDTALRNHLINFGHTVTNVSDEVSPTVGTYDGYVIAESCTGTLDAAAFASIDLPWLSCDIGSWDDCLLASVANDNSATSSRFFDLQTHEITAGITPQIGCQVKDTNAGMWGTPGGAANLAPGAFRFALHDENNAHTMGLCIEEGDNLVGNTPSPARRVGLAYIDGTNSWAVGLTAAGIQLLDQAVDWMLASSGPEEHEGSGAALSLDISLGTGTGSKSISGSGNPLSTDLSLDTGAGEKAVSNSGLPLSVDASLGTGTGEKTAAGIGQALATNLTYGDGSGSHHGQGSGEDLSINLEYGVGIGSGPDVGEPLVVDLEYGTGEGTKEVDGSGAAFSANIELGTGQGEKNASGTGTPLSADISLGTGSGSKSVVNNGLPLGVDISLGSGAGIPAKSGSAAALVFVITYGLGVGFEGESTPAPYLPDPGSELHDNPYGSSAWENKGGSELEVVATGTALLVVKTGSIITANPVGSVAVVNKAGAGIHQNKAGATWRPGVSVFKQNDTAPWLRTTLYADKQNTVALDLTEATGIILNAKKRITPELQTEKFITGAAVKTNDPATDGLVHFVWAAGNTDTVGTYDAEWEVTWSDGSVQTLPPGEYETFDIVAELAPTP